MNNLLFFVSLLIDSVFQCVSVSVYQVVAEAVLVLW